MEPAERLAPARDEVTRYLCAAAHLDPEFADSAVREFLGSPNRAIPPSPGVDSEAVLREALAARGRRVLRDAALLLLLVVALLTEPLVVVLWLLVGLPFAFRKPDPRRAGKQQQGVLIALGVMGVFLVYVLIALEEYNSPRSRYAREPELIPGVDGEFFVLAAIFFLLALLLLLADRFAVHNLVFTSFQRGNFTGAKRTRSWFGEWRFSADNVRAREKGLEVLRRAAVPDDRPRIVVYRGERPFVGTGLVYDPWSLALTLDPADEPGRPVDVDLGELYEALAHGLTELVGPSSLSPSGRLTGLRATEQVVASAAELANRVDDPRATGLLPGAHGRPPHTLPAERADGVAREPQEWLRYFRCFQVESWDRQLVVTWYLHLGCDDGRLYVEWTPTVLMPVRAVYKDIDATRPTPLKPVREALARALSLPLTAFSRARRLVSRLVGPSRSLSPSERYGAESSLRELGAGDEVLDYFQRADLERYAKLMDRQLLRTLGRYLERRGVTTTEFMRQATQVADRHIHIKGSVSGNVFIGDRNTVGEDGKKDDRK
ncbi:MULTISPECIES: hypothetical protein [Actinosynnema]|uniref:hypothetical protein n=1 Tax=Actinosynnema TaxID=40566 RepID=UPI0020A252E9|nr:hypothetical protein [Actinosynnema pretiosum]MCP2094527.1 hypothetical protein [Actinosynnema pretiosum]